MAHGGLTLSEESLKRLVPPQAARNVFLRQTQEDPQAIQARAEGTLRAAAAVKSQRLVDLRRFGLEEERLEEESRRFDVAQATSERARLALERTGEKKEIAEERRGRVTGGIKGAAGGFAVGAKIGAIGGPAGAVIGGIIGVIAGGK